MPRVARSSFAPSPNKKRIKSIKPIVHARHMEATRPIFLWQLLQFGAATLPQASQRRVGVFSLCSRLDPTATRLEASDRSVAGLEPLDPLSDGPIANRYLLADGVDSLEKSFAVQSDPRL